MELFAHLERMRRERESLIDAFRRFTIEAALEATDNCQTGAAELLSMSQAGVHQYVIRKREREVEAALRGGASPRPRVVEALPVTPVPLPRAEETSDATATVGPVVEDSTPPEPRPPVRRFDKHGNEIAFFRGGKPVYRESAEDRMQTAG